MLRAALLALALTLTLGLVACGDDDGDGNAGAPTSTQPPAATQPPAETPQPMATVVGEPTVTASGLQIYEIEAGDGAVAQPGDEITMAYTGYLEDGSVFDSGTISIGLDDLIAGWQEGVPGMQVGGKRRLVIPPELGYGERGFGDAIPPNATLTFDIELISIP